MSASEEIKVKKFQNTQKSEEIILLENKFNGIKQRLNIFKDMKNGDKIMKCNDCSNNTYYYTVGNDDWQRTKRWWYAENRNKTIEYLDTEFDSFAKYLDTVLFNMKQFNLLKFYTLALEVSRYINEILPGLYSLKETYSNYKEMENKVDSIITTLIDYKDQVELYKNENQNRRQLMSNMVIKRDRTNSN